MRSIVFDSVQFSAHHPAQIPAQHAEYRIGLLKGTFYPVSSLAATISKLLLALSERVKETGCIQQIFPKAFPKVFPS